MARVSAVEGIVPIERAQAELPRLLAAIAGSNEAIIIVRDGKAVGVLVSPSEFDALQEEIEHLAAIDEALATIDTEELIDGDRVQAWLRSVGTDHELPPPL